MDQRMNPDQSPEIREAVAAAESELADKGRVVLRASGTEPVIRVMVEGQDEAQVVALAERLASIVAAAAA
jgi:phosphoglucosamine mutase